MKFTSEDLLKAMGLKVKDKIYFKHYVYEILDNDYTDCLYRGNGVFSEFLPLTVLFNEEYTIVQPKPTLTEDEKNFAQLAFNQGYRYLSKNKREKVASITKGNPIRCSDDTWFVESEFYFYLNMFPNLFQFIKWEDEPYSIEELLKEN